MKYKKSIIPIQTVIARLPKNITIKEDTYLGVAKKATFIDPEYGEWTAEVKSVINGARNPKRAIQDNINKQSYSEFEIIEKLKLVHGDLVRIVPGTFIQVKSKARFIDKEFGEFTRSVYEVLKGKRHQTFGTNKFKTAKLIPVDIIEKRLPPYIKLVKETYKSVHAPAKFIDEKYGEWWSSVNDIVSGGRDHPSRNVNRSKGEKNLYEWLVSLGLDVKNNFRLNRGGKSFYEIDCYIPDKKIGIEFNGVKWHSDWGKSDNAYHMKKRIFIETSGITLIQINSDEWLFKQDIVKSIIKSKLNQAQHKYQARKLIIKKVDASQAQSFLKANHLMGEYKSAKHLGLFTKDGILVSLISYKKHKTGIDISRFCNKLYTSVAGGLSRLLKEIERQEAPDFIQSWVDLRYGTGDSLLAVGFKHAKTIISWKWTDGLNTFNRLRCRANMDSRKLTEKEYAEELRWYKIYDAGQALFIKD